MREAWLPIACATHHKLLREVRRDTLTALDRQKQLARSGKCGEGRVKERMRVKRGELT